MNTPTIPSPGREPIPVEQIRSFLADLVAQGLPRTLSLRTQTVADLHAADREVGLNPIAQMPIARLTVAAFGDARDWAVALNLHPPVTLVRSSGDVVQRITTSRGRVAGWRVTVCHIESEEIHHYVSRLGVELGREVVGEVTW